MGDKMDFKDDFAAPVAPAANQIYGSYYTPRKCAWTNRVITAKDHASIQLNIGHLNENGVFTKQFTPIALSGYIRAKAEGDAAINSIAFHNGVMKDINAFPTVSNFKPAQSEL